MPHGHCYLWTPSLVWTMVITDSLIGLAYVSISLSLYGLVKRIKVPFSAVFLAFGVFIAACGATHFMEVWTLWTPSYWMAALVKVITAAASVITALWLVRLKPRILSLAELGALAEKRRVELEKLNEDLEIRVAARTAELEAANRQAQDAIRARDEFLSIASHELKTPMTSLKLQLQITQKTMTKESPSLDRLSQVLDRSDRQVQRLATLVDDLLDVSRIQAGKLQFRFEPVNLSELVKEVLERFADESAAAGCRITTDMQGEVIGYWDSARIEQVVVNLVSNAIKYAPGKPISISVRRSLQVTTLTIQDLGPGIPRIHQSKIFDRFERANSSRNIGGLGLGLYIVKSIVDGHHGSLRLESDVGKGARFIVELPINPAALERRDIPGENKSPSL